MLVRLSLFQRKLQNDSIDLNRQNELDADLRVIQQINFTANLDRAGNTTIFFIIEEAKGTISEFPQGTVKVVNTILLRFLVFKYINDSMQ